MKWGVVLFSLLYFAILAIHMEILSQLFRGTARVKVMRFFLFNENKFFTLGDIASKTRLSKTTASRELRAIEKMGMIRRKELPKVRSTKTTKGKAVKKPQRKSKATEYTLNPRFIYTETLRQLLSLNDPIAHKDITEKLRRAGKIRLLIVTGVFIGRTTDRVDLLIVGDKIKKKEIDRALQHIESDVGREISYAYFDTEDFLYRINVKDRLVRDILDYPHERIINKIDELE
jgi:DNA-binding HxlR family transcriptional regulator